MSDYINKKLTFNTSNITIKIVKETISTTKYSIFHCIDAERPSFNYSLKIMKVNTSEKRLVNSLNTEMLILVNYL